MPPIVHGWKMFSGICLHFFMGEKYFQECAPNCSWVQNIFRILVKNKCPSSAKSICYFSVCHWVVSQGSGSPPAPPLFFLYAEICWDMLSGLSSLSLGWLLNGKQKNSIYSWQRTGIFFWYFSTPIFLSNLICESIQDHNITKYQIFGYIWWPERWPIGWGDRQIRGEGCAS